MKARLPGTLLLAMFVVAGCASAPVPINYYVLAPPATVTDQVIERADQPALVIEDVELAAYLLQSGLVIQSGRNQLVVSRNHLWAESLELAFPKALVRELQRQSDEYSYYLKSLDWVDQADYRLRLRIDALQTTDRGEVLAAGRYQLIPGRGEASSIFVDFNFQRDLEQDGHAHAVEQMSVLLAQIAGAILNSLDHLDREP